MANNNDKKVLNVPALRFPEFTDEWEETELQNIVPNICAGKDKHSNDGTIVLYGSTGIIGMTTNPSYTEELILVARVGANAGQLQVTNTPCGVTDNTLVINAKSWNLYIYYYLQHYNLNRLVFGSGQPLITGGMLKKIKVMYGIKSERDKITHMLCILDERIKLQNKIIEDLKKLKSAICEKLFSSPKDKQPQIRLYGFFGDWHFVRLSDICHRICRKNTGEQCKQVLTIAAQYGLVSQEEFFNKNVASENLSGYYLLQKGDFAYNKSYSGDYVWGTVKRLDNYEQGVLSPLYICFRPDPARVDSDFLIYYFESKKWHKTVANIAGEGARNHGLLNISVVDYFNTIHCIPSMDEQKQIAQIIGTLLSKIAREQRMLNCYAAQRQYLLRQMFI